MKFIILNRNEYEGLTTGRQAYICRPIAVNPIYKLSGQTNSHYLFGFRSKANRAFKRFKERSVFSVKEPTAYRIRKEPGLPSQVDIVYRYDYIRNTACDYSWIPAEMMKREYVRAFIIVLSSEPVRIQELGSGQVFLLGFMSMEEFITDWDERYPDSPVEQNPWIYLVRVKFVLKGKL